jgi:hypothetical protein
MIQKHKRLFWTCYIAYAAFALITGLDNLFYQPGPAGVLIGLSCLAVTTWMIAYPLSQLALK